jgi:energy-coupling factor transporter ATP-binding protein EcfA2
MINRTIRIKNFRNIGTDDFQEICLNSVIDKEDKIGGLITLIGMNNSGKSNYLDAMMYLKTKKINNNDIPIFNYGENNSPIVSLWISEPEKNVKYEYTVKNDKTYIDKYENNKKVNLDGDATQNNDSINQAAEIINATQFDVLLNSNFGIIYQGNKAYSKNIITDYINTPKTLENTKNIYNFLNDSSVRNRYLQSGMINSSKYDVITKNLSDILTLLDKEDPIDIINKEVSDNYGIKLTPNIVKYDDSKKITDANLVINYTNGNLVETDFYNLLFSYLKNISYKRFSDAYNNFHNTGSVKKFYLTNFQKEVNKELKVLSGKFNKIYGTDQKQTYSFRIEIESTKTYFLLSENGSDVPLDNQSTGFKWFFNFFFNVFAGGNLEKGDIVILDEPATNLHVIGQRALRSQIKEFGINNGITFVISTHSPFLIDSDYLDELRLVVKEGNNSLIYNKFAEDFNTDDKVDSFLPIYTALTVDKHILLDPNNILVFVEGITDYNYLTAFKKLYNVDGISFLPFQGLRQKNLINKLIKICKKPILLIDSDKEGDNFYKKYEDFPVLELHMLHNINKEWKQIEDLFSPQDQVAFYTKDKKHNISSYFKSNIFNYEKKMTKKTKDNFKELLDYIKK